MSEEYLIGKIQEIHEDDLSKHVLIPLLKSMGYHHVEFYGGPYEQGKDVIAYMRNDLMDVDDLCVFQAKKIGEVSLVKDNDKVSKLLSQLRKCYLKDVITFSGLEKKPDKVYLVTPYPVRSRFMDDLSEELAIPGSTIYLIDGPRIVNLCKKYDAGILSRFEDSEAQKLLDPFELSNIELRNALNKKIDFKLSETYSDLAFFVGSAESHVLLNSAYLIDSSVKKIAYRDWGFLKKIMMEVEDLLEVNPLTESLKYIEDSYVKINKKYKSEENTKVGVELDKAKKNLINIVSVLGVRISEAQGLYNVLKERSDFLENEREVIFTVPEKLEKIKQIQREISVSKYIFEDIEDINVVLSLDLYSNHTKSINQKFKDMIDNVKDIFEMGIAVKKLSEKYIEKPFVSVSIDKEKMENRIQEKILYYRSCIEVINSRSVSSDYIKLFLEETEKTLRGLNLLIYRSQPLHENIKIIKPQEISSGGVSLSPREVLNSGKDVAIYGGAGAGKTTTLQMYARDFIGSDLVMIYLPLNRLVKRFKDWEAAFLDGKSYTEDSYKLLLVLIILYKDWQPDEKNIQSIFSRIEREGAVKIILDGLDEAYNSIPGLIDSINSFKIAFPKVQLIISSRDCVSYLNKIKFLGITLLPFTNEQFKKFVTRWLDDKRSSAVHGLIEQYSLQNIFNTPLLATLLCDLVEKGVDIPRSETEIYSKRLTLLCGDYDHHKSISRVSFTRDALELASYKMAYKMHTRGTRTATKSNLILWLSESEGFPYSLEACTRVVEELIDPCNVLVYDNLLEQYSFGHFRFQEHLVSVEISNNRGIELVQYLTSDWWRGVLFLFAQKNEISFLIEEVQKSLLTLSSAETTLRYMIEARPKAERKVLYDLLDNFLTLERSEGPLDFDQDAFPHHIDSADLAKYL